MNIVNTELLVFGFVREVQTTLTLSYDVPECITIIIVTYDYEPNIYIAAKSQLLFKVNDKVTNGVAFDNNFIYPTQKLQQIKRKSIKKYNFMPHQYLYDTPTYGDYDDSLSEIDVYTTLNQYICDVRKGIKRKLVEDEQKVEIFIELLVYDINNKYSKKSQNINPCTNLIITSNNIELFETIKEGQYYKTHNFKLEHVQTNNNYKQIPNILMNNPKSEQFELVSPFMGLTETFNELIFRRNYWHWWCPYIQDNPRDGDKNPIDCIGLILKITSDTQGNIEKIAMRNLFRNTNAILFINIVENHNLKYFTSKTKPQINQILIVKGLEIVNIKKQQCLKGLGKDSKTGKQIRIFNLETDYQTTFTMGRDRLKLLDNSTQQTSWTLAVADLQTLTNTNMYKQIVEQNMFSFD
eukprot:160643_1